MINPISFGSTYKVSTNSKDNEVIAFDKFQELCEIVHSERKGSTKYEDKVEKKYPYNWSATQTLVVPESLDRDVERYCALHGITFTKIFTHKLLRPENIFSRIQPAPKDKVLAYVNTKKLDKLIEKQSSNFAHVKSDYEDYFNRKTDLALKSGDKFATSTLYINPKDGSEDALKYIIKNGANALNDNSMTIWLNQETFDPDHCMYFAMKDLGIKSIPVYLDKESYAIGNALGLFE